MPAFDPATDELAGVPLKARVGLHMCRRDSMHTDTPKMCTTCSSMERPKPNPTRRKLAASSPKLVPYSWRSEVGVPHVMLDRVHQMRACTALMDPCFTVQLVAEAWRQAFKTT